MKNEMTNVHNKIKPVLEQLFITPLISNHTVVDVYDRTVFTLITMEFPRHDNSEMIYNDFFWQQAWSRGIVFRWYSEVKQARQSLED